MHDPAAKLAASPRAAFAAGALVLVTLNSPREKFWGAVLEITAAGVSLRGTELNSLDDVAAQLRAGEPVSASAVFFPMHRVERMELDERCGDIPSLLDRFRQKAGERALRFLGLEDGE